ncbi:MAG TPA: ATP-grasp domain-containing protein [Marinilabiliaceae bacterium]|nr:ATP-grasp domain-containing protein [Marinilabiliaceae bacterium]
MSKGSKSKIAIIGASYLQLPLYLKAKELGIETIGFSWAIGAVAKKYCSKFYEISTTEKEQILEICKAEKIDGILTIATDIAVPTVNYIASKMGLIGNSQRSGLLATNKFEMRKAFKKNNINSPAFFKVSRIEDLSQIENKLKYPVIVKPVDRSGSKGITKVSEQNQLKSAVVRAISEAISKTAIIEHFVVGNEISVECISYKGQHNLLAITDKVTSGPPHFVELEHHQPSNLSKELQTRVEQMTKAALNALEIEYGASHSEFIITPDDVYITEVGARMGGDFIGSDLVYLSTGYDFLQGIIDIALNQFSTPVKTKHLHSGVLFYSKSTPMLKELTYTTSLKTKIVRSQFDENLKNDLTESSNRSGYCIYQSSEKISYFH